MSNYIEISTTQLNNDREQMQQQMQKILDEINKLSDEIQELNSMWTGPANAVYNQQTGEDFTKLGELLDQIGNFVQCMEFAAQEYVRCENSVADSVAAIRIL